MNRLKIKRRVILPLLVVFGLSLSALSQTAVLMPSPRFKLLDQNGQPAAGGCLFFYTAGTSSPLSTYADSNGSTLNSNPVILDSTGEAWIYLMNATSYKVVAKLAGTVANCADGTQLWSADNVLLPSSGAVGGVNGQIQYNCLGAFCGAAGLSFNAISQTLSMSGLNVTSGGSLAGAFTASGSWAFTGNNTFTGLSSFSSPGVFSNTQMNPFIKANLNAIDFAAQFHITNGVSVYGTDVYAAGMTVPASASATQANGFGAYIQNLSTATNAVGAFSSVSGHVANSNNWGANFLCQIDTGFANQKCTGVEVDLNNQNADATEGQALIQDAINVISGGSFHPRAGVVVSASSAAANAFQDAFSANAYNTFGVKLQGGAVGSIAHYIVPPDDTSALEIAGRNNANTLNSWSIQNAGNATFPLVTVLGQQYTESSGVVVALTGSDVCRGNSSTHQKECSYNNGTFFRATQTIGTGTSTSNGTAVGSGVSQAQPAITITGATVTDVATCSLNAAPVATWQTGIQLLPAVVTANTVTPWLSNPSAGSITPAAAVIRCTVIR